jgi:uncharacterized protein
MRRRKGWPVPHDPYIWDVPKAEANYRKHGVKFGEAATVFADPLSKVYPDPDHSALEERWVIIGESNRRRLLLVVFVERGATIRIISARRIVMRERRFYEEDES